MSGFLIRDARDRGYRIYVPPGSAPADGWPVILFLHGAGECGADNQGQLRNGLPAWVMANPERWPFIVVCPQKLDVAVMWEDCIHQIDAMLDAVDREFSPDPSRRYLTGLSQGGHGTFTLVRRLYWRFAASVPICGWGDPRDAARDLAHVPTWIFHGDADDAVPVEASIAIAKWLKAEDSRLTVYPGVGHNSWDLAYRELELPGWLLSHRLV